MSLTPMFVIWIALGLATLGLALYRKLIASNEEDIVRLGPGEEKYVSEQTELANKLSVIDRWGKTLTVITLVLGLILGVIYVYMAWGDPSLLPKNLYRVTQ